MAIRVGINGFGRIGRNIMRAALEDREIDFVAVRPAGAFEVVSQRLLDEPVASDHRPVFVELVWP